ncbi:MAG TPA: VTT domain-containing protein [Thiobacillus sp.]|nr:VTT domain-containing protein [Thiobacillus sp.]
MSPYKRLVTVLLFLGVLLAIFELTGLRDHFSLEFLRQTILDNKISGLFIFILVFALGNLIQIPGWVFLAAAVLALGRTWGGIATYVAASISCVISFLIIRFVGGDALRLLNNRIATRILKQLDAHPIKSILLSRVFFQTLPALNYALAMSGVRFRNYLLGTLLGLPLPIALYCLFFDYLAKAFHVI